MKVGDEVICIKKGEFSVDKPELDDGLNPKYNETVTIKRFKEISGYKCISLVEYGIHMYYTINNFKSLENQTLKITLIKEKGHFTNN